MLSANTARLSNILFPVFYQRSTSRIDERSRFPDGWTQNELTPEDVRLTDIDNVFLLRGVRRLSPAQRGDAEAIAQCHTEHPVREDVLWRLVQEMQIFVDAVWYDPSSVLQRGSFI